MVHYRFDRFTLSPGRRHLLLDGQEVPLIPKYFDLLLLLIERRHEAVHRREIFERVWSDTVVSDSALSQAVRTIRRALGDDSKEPRYIRTVSRHGYRFVFDGVVEERDAAPAGESTSVASVSPAVVSTADASWRDAAIGGGAAGLIAGAVGGVLLAVVPGSTAPFTIAPVLAVVGGAAGTVGGLGVGAGLVMAASRVERTTPASLVAGAALGGALVGIVVQWLLRWTLLTLLGIDVAIGGALEGAVVGMAAGGGMALTPQQASPMRAMATMAVVCGVAGLALTLLGRPLVGGTLHAMAQAADGSRAMLAPLGRLIGEPDFGPLSRLVIAFCECAAFGVGLAWRRVGRVSVS